MPTLTMAPTLGDLLKYELNGSYSRETVTLKAGTNYALGSVLGKITATTKYRLSPAAEVVGDEGAETAVAVLLEAVDATSADKTGLIVGCRPVEQSEIIKGYEVEKGQYIELSKDELEAAAIESIGSPAMRSETSTPHMQQD